MGLGICRWGRLGAHCEPRTTCPLTTNPVKPCPGITFPKKPKDSERAAYIETTFNNYGIQVVWRDESGETKGERRTKDEGDSHLNLIGVYLKIAQLIICQ